MNAVLADERLLEHSVAYARELVTQCSPASMATMKRQVYADIERGLAEALETANQLMLPASPLRISPRG